MTDTLTPGAMAMDPTWTPPPPSRGAATSRLSIWLEDGEAGVVIHVEGELDLAGGADLATTMAARCAGHPRPVAVDATAVRFIDLSGYRALLASTAALDPSGARPALLGGASIDRLRTLAAAACCELEPMG